MVDELVTELRRFREAAGLTQMEFAQRMGVSGKTMNTIKNEAFTPFIFLYRSNLQKLSTYRFRSCLS